MSCPKEYFCPGGKDKIKCDNKTLPGACPNKGMAQPIEGSDEDGKARYLSGGKLKLCEKGYYCDGTRRYACKAGTYADTTGSTQCKQAPVGVAILGAGCTGSSDKNNWKVCAAGTYAEGEGNIGCKKCPSGTYQNQKGQGSCISCPEGQMSKEGATKVSECKSCENEAQKTATQKECCSSSNKVAVKNEATGFEICCPAGKRYCKGKNTKSFACYADKECALTQEQAETQDKHCTEKQYVKNNVCTACPAGYSCNGSSAEKCKPGSYAPAGSGVCTLCPAGKYQTASGQESCKTPTGNQYVDEEGATTVKHCEGINVVPNNARTGCKTCPEGTMPDKNHAVCSGRSCQKGFMYVDGACRRCLENHYCPNGYQEIACGESSFSLPGAVKCTTCKAGTYWNPTSGSCQKCPAGFMCAKGLKSKCPSGTTSSDGAGKCYSCNPGQYFKSNSCKACDAGTYSAGGTVTKCKACPEGTRQPQKGQGSCVNCPTGKWSNAGSAECKIKCPAKFFCSDGKKEKCAKCKAGATTKP